MLILIISIFTVTGCEFIGNTFEYKKTTEEFSEALINEDYDTCVDLFALDHEMAQNTNIDTMRAGLPKFRAMIINNFGENLEYTLMSSEKKFSTVEGESTPPNTTRVLVQIENPEEFGVLKVLFDDTSKKILNLNALDVKEEIPNMFPFWLFGLLAICIPIFNIYVINQIRKSNLKRKWLKYLAVLFFNVPAITYSAVSGLGFKLLNFQILLGISFSYMGYLNSMWAFGIPLGGIYWLWKLKTKKEESQLPEITNDEILDNFERD